MITLTDYLDSALPEIQPELIPLEQHESMRFAANGFPAQLMRCFDLECRLGSNPSPTDLLFCVTRSEREMLAADAAFLLQNSAVRAQLLWQHIRSFIQYWADPTSQLHDKVIMLWFEFDLPTGAGDMVQSSLSAPGFFFGSKEFPPQCIGDGIQQTNRADSWVYDTALPLLSGSALPREIETNLRRVSANLPDGAHIYQIGIFYARAVPHLRVCITAIQPEIILPYLRSIGYSADLSGLEAVISEISPLCQIHLDIDVSETIGPKVGLECTQDRSRNDLLDEKNAHLLSLLHHYDLCTPEKASALLAFPGVERLPSAFRELHRSQKVGAQSGPALLRDVSHLKIVYQPGQPLEAKAYLQFNHVWLDDFALVANKLSFAARERAARQALQRSLINHSGILTEEE